MSDFEKVLKGLECCTTSLGCKACPYSEKGVGTDDCQLESTQDALELLKMRQWISAKVKLPEPGKNVLTLDSMGNYFIGSYSPDTGWDEQECDWNPVKWWMPLPEPPKESESE